MTDETHEGRETPPGSPGPTDEVGSVGEEAAKLLGALNDWAKEAGAGHVHSATSAAEGFVRGLKDVDSHIATRSADCSYCPICQAIALVRQTSPEVRAHLSTAASSLLQAAAGLLATQVPESGPGRPKVEKITLDESPENDEPR